MTVYNTYRPGLIESAYEAALQYVLLQNGFKAERQVLLPIYWNNVKLEQFYKMDLVVNDNIIIELKAVTNVITAHRRQLWSYMNLTHCPYGMLINYSPELLYSEWYEREADTGMINRVRLM